MLESFSQTWTHKMQKQKTICVGYFLTNFFVTIMKRNGFMMDVDCTINIITHSSLNRPNLWGNIINLFIRVFQVIRWNKHKTLTLKCAERIIWICGILFKVFVFIFTRPWTHSQYVSIVYKLKLLFFCWTKRGRKKILRKNGDQ